MSASAQGAQKRHARCRLEGHGDEPRSVPNGSRRLLARH